MTKIVDIRGVTYRYKTKEVLKNISLTFNKGELGMIIGPNGSGKSTLLKCIIPILKISNESIFINGIDRNKYTGNELSKIISYVPQIEVIGSGLTVFDTILMGRKPYITSQISAKDLEIVESIITQLNLSSYAFREINTLSGGERQMVFIGRALAQEPQIIILDEPTANLDLYNQLKIMELLSSLANKGITVIMSEHNINIASRFADKLLMLKDGEIIQYGGKEVITSINLKTLYNVEVSVLTHNNTLHVVTA